MVTELLIENQEQVKNLYYKLKSFFQNDSILSSQASSSRLQLLPTTVHRNFATCPYLLLYILPNLLALNENDEHKPFTLAEDCSGKPKSYSGFLSKLVHCYECMFQINCFNNTQKVGTWGVERPETCDAVVMNR